MNQFFATHNLKVLHPPPRKICPPWLAAVCCHSAACWGAVTDCVHQLHGHDTLCCGHCSTCNALCGHTGVCLPHLGLVAQVQLAPHSCCWPVQKPSLKNPAMVALKLPKIGPPKAVPNGKPSLSWVPRCFHHHPKLNLPEAIAFLAMHAA